MSELAFNINGEAFEVPAHATGWRVRRMRAKGSPEVVYGRDGLPLVLPIDAELDDLKAEVNLGGRHRLDLVDQNNKAIPDVPSGYVQVNPEAPAIPSSTAIASVLPSKPSDNIVIEAMRTQSAMALAVIERFPQMMESAANLLRAADGAGLPARAPRAEEDDDDDDDVDDEQPEARPGFDLNAFVAQVIPMIVMGLGNGTLKVPGLGEMLDWRKAAPSAKQKPAKANKPARPDGPGDAGRDDKVPENATDVLPPIDPQTMAHFIAIQSALKPEEAVLARDVAGNLGAAELRAWFDELSKLSVPQAVQKIRVLIAGNTEAVS